MYHILIYLLLVYFSCNFQQNKAVTLTLLAPTRIDQIMLEVVVENLTLLILQNWDPREQGKLKIPNEKVLSTAELKLH